MTDTETGRAALMALLANETVFPRIKDADLSAAAIKLARKQLIAAGQSRQDLLQIQSVLGTGAFDKALDGLSPHHIKLLARRLDRQAPEIEVNTGSSALAYVRQILTGDVQPTAEAEPAIEETPAPAAPKKNKYLGRKAFRTGR